MAFTVSQTTYEIWKLGELMFHQLRKCVSTESAAESGGRHRLGWEGWGEGGGKSCTGI